MSTRYCEIVSHIERVKMAFELAQLEPPVPPEIIGGRKMDVNELGKVRRRLGSYGARAYGFYRRRIWKEVNKKWGKKAELHISTWEGWNSGLLEDFMVSEMNVKLK